MGYKCRFIDNEEYSAEDVSEVFSLLVSDGVVPYPQSATTTEALTNLTSSVTSNGVAEDNGLVVTVSQGMINVGAGSAFFESGVSVTVDADGVSVPRGNASQVYVAWVYDEEYNTVSLYHDTQMPTGDYVLLAQITNNTVRDMRTFSSAKRITNMSNVYQELRITLTTIKSKNNFDGVYSERNRLINRGFRYLIIKRITLDGTTKRYEYEVFDIGNNEVTDCYLFYSLGEYYLRVKRESEYISFAAISSGNSNVNATMVFDLLLA